MPINYILCYILGGFKTKIMLLVKFEKTIQVNEDEWRNVFIEKVFDKTETLETIVNWAKENQDKPRKLSATDEQKLDVRGLIITEI